METSETPLMGHCRVLFKVMQFYSQSNLLSNTPEIFLEPSEDIRVGVILGGVNNHIKVSMLHPLKYQKLKRVCSLKVKCTGENTEYTYVYNITLPLPQRD